ncbi:hypothetical protein ACWCRF_14460 [Streptomyces sp. NPDC002405]
MIAARRCRADLADQRIPFTEATVTAGDDGSYGVARKAPGAHAVSIHANGRVVARGGAEGGVTVRGLPAADRQWFDLVPDRGARCASPTG